MQYKNQFKQLVNKQEEKISWDIIHIPSLEISGSEIAKCNYYIPKIGKKCVVSSAQQM